MDGVALDLYLFGFLRGGRGGCCAPFQGRVVMGVFTLHRLLDIDEGDDDVFDCVRYKGELGWLMDSLVVTYILEVICQRTLGWCFLLQRKALEVVVRGPVGRCLPYSRGSVPRVGFGFDLGTLGLGTPNPTLPRVRLIHPT